MIKNAFYVLMWTVIALAAAAAQCVTAATVAYSGYVNVTMGGETTATNTPGELKVTADADGTCSITLPGMIADGSIAGVGSMGEIVVPGVSVTTDADGVSHYSCTDTEVAMLGGMMKIKVSVDGVIRPDNMVRMKALLDMGGVSMPGLPALDLSMTMLFTTNKISVTSFDGLMDIAVGSLTISRDVEKTVTVTNNGDGTSEFLIPGLTVQGIGDIGDVTLEDIGVVESADGSFVYTGEAAGVGSLKIDWIVSGTVSADGVAEFTFKGKKSIVAFTLTFKSAVEEPPVAVVSYPGFVNVIRDEEVLVADRSATLAVSYYADGTCTLVIPSVAVEGVGETGDIELADVDVAEGADGVRTLTGGAQGIKILGGLVSADVSIAGTIDTADVVDLRADVSAMGMALVFTFTTEAVGGVGATRTAADARVDVYNLGGVCLLRGATLAEAARSLPKGLYVAGSRVIVVK